MAVDQKIIVRVLLRDRGKLLAYIGAIVRDAHIAEDVLQEVSMLALEKQEQILNEAAVLPWMRTAARFRSLKALEKLNRRPAFMDNALLDLMEDQWREVDNTPSEDMANALRNCVAKLTPYAQQLIGLRYGSGLGAQQIADSLNRKVDAVYKALTRTHAALAQCVRKRLEG
ncbi:MAG: hypothetical protein MI741_11185 [Rhodospirillales bacterium]|nr:hypothetical protein [Rhodospirillales bacterium]